MNTTTRRILLILPFVLLFLAVMLMLNFRNQKEVPQVQEETEQAREINTQTVSNQPIQLNIDIQGELFAFDKVEIYSEVGGLMIYSANPFKKGVAFGQGAVLSRIDNEEARLQLLSQKASLLTAITQIMPDLKIDHPESYPAWQAYLSDFNPEESIQPMPEAKNDQEKFFVASRNIYTQYYTIKSAENRLAKYIIKAPFNGVLTEALVQNGTVIRAGQKLGTFMRTGLYELEAKVPLSEIQYIRVGNRMSLSESTSGKSWEGKVKRISDQIDRSSQTVSVFISVSGKDLKEGMYLKGNLASGLEQDGIVIPQELLLNGKSVYTVKSGQLVEQEVEVVRIEGDMAIVKGLEEGTVIPQRVIPGAYSGLKVKAIGSGSATEASNN